MRSVVVATGGGTFVDPDNRQQINLDGTSVWLDLPLVDLIPRIPLDGRRPLAANRAQLERLYASRLDAYRMAHIRVAPGGAMPVAAVVDHVMAALQQRDLLNRPSAGV